MKDETIDVLDEQGKKTGQELSLKAAHEKELWHGVSHAWVYNTKSQILLHLRHPDLSWGANQWDIAGAGHISAKESPEQAAVRELQEEMGISIKQEQLKLAGITTSINVTPTTGHTHRVYEWNYIVEMDPKLQDLKLQEDEVTEAKWFNLSELEADLDDENKRSQYVPRSKQLWLLVINKIRQNTKE